MSFPSHDETVEIMESDSGHKALTESGMYRDRIFTENGWLSMAILIYPVARGQDREAICFIAETDADLSLTIQDIVLKQRR